MATELQKQLAVIAATSTRQLDLKAQKRAHAQSLLFETKVAASQSFDSIYLICHQGFRDLCALDARFVSFSTSLFSEQSKAEDRIQMTQKENEKLNAVLETFITLIGPKILLKPAEKALEWLVRRFRVHEYNTESLVLTYLPYHDSPQFLALLSILPAHPPTALRFLSPYIPSPTNPPRRVISYTATNTPAFFDAYQSYLIRAVKSRHHTAPILSFWSSITVEMIWGVVNAARSGKKELRNQNTEQLVLRILPFLYNCMRAEYGADAVAACLTIVIVLVNQANLGDKLLDGLAEAVLLAHDSDSLLECLACLTIINGERSVVELSKMVYKRLAHVPQLVPKLCEIAKTCQVDGLLLAYALSVVQRAKVAEQVSIISHICQTKLLSTSQTHMLFAKIILELKKHERGSEKHIQMLQLVVQLSEWNELQDSLQDIATQHGVDLESIGLPIRQIELVQHVQLLDSEDDEMLDVVKHIDGVAQIKVPKTFAISYLYSGSDEEFEIIVKSFQEAVKTKQFREFCYDESLGAQCASQESKYLSFFLRVWCGPYPTETRVAALKAVKLAIVRTDTACDFQNMLPYLLCGLADQMPAVRRSAALCVAALLKISANGAQTPVWAQQNLYGTASEGFPSLKQDDVSSFLKSVLKPVLEESVMDQGFIVNAVKEALQSPKSSDKQSKSVLKSQTRSSILSFLVSHAALTPLLRVRLCLLPISGFASKSSEIIRNSVIVPLVRRWCSLSASTAQNMCESQDLDIGRAEEVHLSALAVKDTDSFQLLKSLIADEEVDRTTLLNAAFDRVKFTWSSINLKKQTSLAHCLTDLSLIEANDYRAKLKHERAIETIRSLKFHTETLFDLLELKTSSGSDLDQHQTKKRKLTQNNTSNHESAFSLRRLAFVLELVESASPQNHPRLFTRLFNVFIELQSLKQKTSSELVYLHSLVLGSLAQMVGAVKTQPDSADYKSVIRADLLVDCIRCSTSRQVQNDALILLGNLASWIPDKILHNVMPIFTFLGSTLLRQQDDYSVHIVDKTISRVVPQLVASLRSKHQNVLLGTSELLLNFSAAFQHIPSQRRLKLFSELALTLGLEDSLSTIIALLADRYYNDTTQRKFSVELLLSFPSIYILHAFKGCLDLARGITSKNDRVANTFFGSNDKQPFQVESTLKRIFSSLLYLMSDGRIQQQVIKAFQLKIDPSRPGVLFANTIESTIQLTQTIQSVKVRESCRNVLRNSLQLLPTVDLIRTGEFLLVNADPQVQVVALRSVQARASNTIQNDQETVKALIEFLPTIEHSLQQSENEIKISALDCADVLIEKLGKTHVQPIKSLSEIIASETCMSFEDDRIRSLSMICLAATFEAIADQALDLLPKVLPVAFSCLSGAIEEKKINLHDACLAFLSAVVTQVGFVFTADNHDTVLRLVHRCASTSLDESCRISRQNYLEVVARCTQLRHVLAGIQSSWADALIRGFEASMEHLFLIIKLVDTQKKGSIMKSSSTLFNLFYEMFQLREAIATNEGVHFEDSQVKQVEEKVVEAAIMMILKLNDVTFRPFFAQLVEAQGSHESITFYKFLAAFFERFKSIVTNYASYITKPATKTLTLLARDESQAPLRDAVLDALQNSFQHDQDGFWHSPSHHTMILAPLISLLALPSAINSSSPIISTITALAASSSSSIDAHRDMNILLLQSMRSASASERLATVLCEQALTRKLGEEWLSLLPEMLPFISELREDDDERVEMETMRWIGEIEGILGESLEGMLS